MKIVLANSVGIGPQKERYVHFPSRWTAVESPSWYDHKKGWMTFYPFMLAYCSSLLKRDTGNEVKLLDGNLKNWNHETYLKKIEQEKPDWLVMETSTLAFAMDLRLAIDAKRKTNCRIVFCGQHPSAYPEEMLKAGVDYVCIGEYEQTVLELTSGRQPLSGRQPKKIEGLHPNGRRKPLDPDSLPWPEDEDVSRIDYIEPCVSEYREIELFASRGCPLACNFCVAANVYYGGAGTWRPRSVDNVTDEIAHLKNKYPAMEGIFFDDEAHNGKKEFIISLCKSIVKKKLHTLKYNAMCGYWNLDEETLSWMKKAGYYKLRIGIETADKSVALRMQKSHSIKKLYRTLEAAKKIGIKIYGTFTYGAIGSDAVKDEATTSMIEDLLKKRLLYDLQISICTPQPGTPFFLEADKANSITTKEWKMYDGGRNVIQSYPGYSAKKILETVAKARRVASRYTWRARVGKTDFSGISTHTEPAEQNILLICTGPRWQTDEIIKELLKNHPKEKIGILLGNQAGKGFDGFRVWRFGDGPLSVESMEGATLDAVKKSRYRLAVVQLNHNMVDRSDYADVFRIAEEVSEKWICVDINGKVITETQTMACR